jgi:surfeit locus 1 family protein
MAAVGFGLLGRWQWHRADEKRQQLAAFAAGSQQQLQLHGQALSSLPRFALVVLSGRYDPDHQFLLDNISHGGRVGYEVLTPLQLEDGRSVLVNRGWLPLRDEQRAQLPDIALSNAAALPQSLRARVDELPVSGLAAGRAPPTTDQSWPKLTSFPTTAELSAALGRKLESRQLLLAADQPSGYLRDWQPPNPEFGPERHISYAIQWWSLATLAIALYFVVNLKKSG